MTRTGMSSLFAKTRRKTPPAFKPEPETEDKLHKSVAVVLRDYVKPDWRWTSFPAGEKRDAITGARLKSMGLMRGWPDIQLISPEGIYHGLELKRSGGKLSEAQIEFQTWANRLGIPHAVCFDLPGVLDTLGKWNALRFRIVNGIPTLGGEP